jgi:hypothetical protein
VRRGTAEMPGLFLLTIVASIGGVETALTDVPAG